jgi:hypothetical protein
MRELVGNPLKLLTVAYVLANRPGGDGRVIAAQVASP